MLQTVVMVCISLELFSLTRTDANLQFPGIMLNACHSSVQIDRIYVVTTSYLKSSTCAKNTRSPVQRNGVCDIQCLN